jgi:hypothetical protein
VAKSDSAGDLYLREDLAAPKGKGPMDRRAMVDVAGPIDNTPLGWSHAIVLMNTCMVMFLEGHDMQVTSYAAPAIIKAWHLTSADFGPVFGFGLLGYFLGATILGHLGDRKENVVGRNQFFKNSTAQ